MPDRIRTTARATTRAEQMPREFAHTCKRLEDCPTARPHRATARAEQMPESLPTL